MDTGPQQAVECPFHAVGSTKGFRGVQAMPDLTKEWAQLLIVAVRVASLPGLLSTTTISGVRGTSRPTRPRHDGSGAGRGYGGRQSRWSASATSPIGNRPPC